MLSDEAARKDALLRSKNNRPTMQHRHFATIAAIIAGLPDGVRNLTAEHFARELAATNPRFDRERFLSACSAD